MSGILTSDFKTIVMNDTPLIDVRAPIEYDKGAFPGSINLPIMNDQERHEVGIKYKESGNDAATELGYSLVSGNVKAERVEGWKSFIKDNPNAMLYCFRGGSRSRISQEWLKETGIDITRLEGGYKAFRNYLIHQMEPKQITSKPIVLTGCTGSGKTILLSRLPHAIDLEGIANHRGSAFGNFIDGQPTQINFENRLAYAVIKNQQQYKHMVLEDESRNVGKCYIPKDLLEYFRSGPYVLLDVPLDERVDITFKEYVEESQQRYIEYYGNEGLEKWHSYIAGSMEKVQKRLGGDRLKTLLAIFNEGYREQLSTGNGDGHKEWIKVFLRDYYDPMYQYQIKQKDSVIAYRGNHDEVYEYLMELR